MKRLALVAVLFAAPVLAEDPAPALARMFPTFALCNAGNTLCAAPAAAVVPYTFDLGTGNVGPGIVFAGGYGLTWAKGGIGYGGDLLFGTTTNGGWNLSAQGKIGKAGEASFRIGPILQHGGSVPGNRWLVGAGLGL